MTASISGIIPVMLTPFDDEGNIDWADLEALIEWYIARGSTALFAVCQSSEMQYLSVAERAELARFTVGVAKGRLPVVASGHVAETPDEQAAELRAVADSGVDGVVMVTNRLDPQRSGPDAFRANLERLMAALPGDLALGLYECPAPYRRLLSDDELKFCCDSGRFAVLKDVSCDLQVVKRRMALAEGSPLAVVNANSAIARAALDAGAPGFSGIANNYHPDLYRWLAERGRAQPSLAKELGDFLTLAALSEGYGYPAVAKLYHQRLGTLKSARCRVIDYDVRERHWALDAILDALASGTEHFRLMIRGT